MSQQTVHVVPNQDGTEGGRGTKEEPAASLLRLHREMFEAWGQLEKAQHDKKQLKRKQSSRGHGEREPREREETEINKGEKPERKQELSEKDEKLTQEGEPVLYRPKFYSYPGFPGFPNFG